MKFNPARDVKKLSYSTSGFHSWTPDEVEQFEAFYPIGTKARLAFALLSFTGVRREDVVHLGRQHVKDGLLRFLPLKMRYKRKADTDITAKPWLPELAEIVAASPCGDLTFLVTSFGKPFTAAGFGNWWREQCTKAGLPECTAHGLRKAGAARAAQMGATVHQLMAIYDWSTIAQAEVYTRAADKKRLAGDAMKFLSRR